jgi:hypothetical protein
MERDRILRSGALYALARERPSARTGAPSSSKACWMTALFTVPAKIALPGTMHMVLASPTAERPLESASFFSDHDRRETRRSRRVVNVTLPKR